MRYLPIITRLSPGICLVFALACSNKPVRLSFANSASCEGGSQNKCAEDAADATTDSKQVTAPENDDEEVVEPKESNVPEVEAFTPVVNSISVLNKAGQAPSKGEDIVIQFELANKGKTPGDIVLSPFLTREGFVDYADVAIGTAKASLEGMGSTRVSIPLASMFKNEGGDKSYALTDGAYTLKFDFEQISEGKSVKNKVDSSTGSAFEIKTSNTVFTAVMWETAYLDALNYKKGIQQFLVETFTHPSEILVPDAKNGSTGKYKSYPKGFDQMMGINTVFQTFEGYRLANAENRVDQVGVAARKALGLLNDFQHSNCETMTMKENHGYDMAILLSKEGYGGGIARRCGNLQTSCVFEDKNSKELRTKVVLIHETSHNYGSPHCNDDGLYGFVMCSGEEHEHYKSSGKFVWHQNSIDAMSKVKGLRSSDSFSLNQGALPRESTVIDSCEGFQ